MSAPTPPPDSAAHLDQVRDILFGDQNREVRERLDRIEDRLQQSVQRLRDDLTQRVTHMESQLRGAHEALASEIRLAHKRHDELGREVHQRLDDTQSALDRKTAELHARVEHEILQTGRNVQQVVHQLRDDLRREHQDALAALRTEAAALRESKQDRGA